LKLAGVFKLTLGGFDLALATSDRATQSRIVFFPEPPESQIFFSASDVKTKEKSDLPAARFQESSVRAQYL
jgi:hypothetical protein